MDRRIVRPASDDAKVRAAALRRALDEAVTIERMAEAARLQSYRAYLQATVGFVSPILLNAIARVDIPIDDVADLLRPPRGWPRRDPGAQSYRQAAAAGLFEAAETRAASAEVLDARVARGGRGGALHLETRALGLLVVRVVGRSLEVALRLRASSISSIGGVGRLRTDRLLPETVTMDCIGRPVSEIVDHPLLRGRGWTVDRIEGRPDGAGFTVLVFATGQEPLTLPWSAC